MCPVHFFYCKHCGNFVGTLHFSGAIPVCCGEKMTEVIPNTVDAAQEKHVPVIEADGNKVTVKVGSVTHPMTEEHLIQWIYLQTESGAQRKCLAAGDAPEATFMLTEGDKPVAAYAYCNLHGLWMTEA